ncbi:MAG: hypothetical protein KC478_11975, partial [Bacteriovoracaceae bacterium]|nr:hypothetical protein [Bacteriovoracaceae bacterium]
SHPYKKAVPEGFVDYPARIRKGGKVAFFNYELAKEMGLIPKSHPEKMDKELEKKLLETFGIVIINEFDEMNGRSFPEKDMKSGKYMATRYLQLQHEDKTGKTSGDGRSVWNGQVKNKGKVWDISSCGTGATRLSPATAKFNKFFETGDPTISYGCGYAELDEGLSTALFSDIFKQNGIATEQTLCVVEFEKNYSVNVRAHSSLLRPSHFFGYLKQGQYDNLKAAVDYYIESRRGDEQFLNCPKGQGKYDFLLDSVCRTFAQTTATFEDEYIFCWLDWDGDNILMDGGIIDYGSVRQFGLFHYEYRYDDVERFSTNILEQKEKAKKIVQSFIQLIDFIKNKEKQSLSKFKNHKVLDDFEAIFEETKNLNLLGKIGFNEKVSQELLIKHPKEVEEFRKAFTYFERAKSSRGLVRISDGVTWDAIFCMRDLMRELPQIYLSRDGMLEDREFIDILKSNYAKKDDLVINSYRSKKIKEFQNLYLELVEFSCKISAVSKEKRLLEMTMRSSVINKMERVTGDAISLIVDLVMKRRKSLGSDEVYKLFKKFSLFQALDPSNQSVPNKKMWNNTLMRQLYEIVKECREGI